MTSASACVETASRRRPVSTWMLPTTCSACARPRSTARSGVFFGARARAARVEDRERLAGELERLSILAEARVQGREQAQRFRFADGIAGAARERERGLERALCACVTIDVEVEQAEPAQGLDLPAWIGRARRGFAHRVHLTQLRGALAPAAQDGLALGVDRVAFCVRARGQERERAREQGEGIGVRGVVAREERGAEERTRGLETCAGGDEVLRELALIGTPRPAGDALGSGAVQARAELRTDGAVGDLARE